MKPLPILLSLMIITGCQSVVKQPAIPTDSTLPAADTTETEEFIRPFEEIVTVDLNNDSLIDTITMNEAPNGDPGTFKKVTVALNGGYRESYHLNDA